MSDGSVSGFVCSSVGVIPAQSLVCNPVHFVNSLAPLIVNNVALSQGLFNIRVNRLF